MTTVETTTAPGRVARVIGPVVDVEFGRDAMPEVYNALTVDITLGHNTRTLTLEVEQHIGDDMVRCISMAPTDGLVRGAEVRDSGGPITVPVGNITKGHVFNVLGRPLDVTEDQLKELLSAVADTHSRESGQKIVVDRRKGWDDDDDDDLLDL